MTVSGFPGREVTSRYGLVNPQKTGVPHPASLVIDHGGTIRHLRVDEDYRKRPSAAELLAAVDALREGRSGG